MATLVRQWERSDESRQAFAARHGLTVSQLEYWKRRVREEAPVSLAAVQVLRDADAAAGGSVELLLTTGERLTIHEGVSADLVRCVVTALRTC
jgi:transposase-like protein